MRCLDPRSLRPIALLAGELLAVLLATHLVAGLLWPAGASADTVPPPTPPTLVWPLDGVPPVVRGFDPPAGPYSPGHRGVDLAAPAGAPVRAAGSGRVVYAGDLAGRPVVSIEHSGGLRTTYEPVRPIVHRGDAVTYGTLIGTLIGGHPGCPMAACLHWGALLNGQYVDPLTLLAGLGGPVRLLPLDGHGRRSGGSARGLAVVLAARRWLGTPYVFAGGDARGPTTGTEPGIGFDCSGLTLYAWAQVGVSLPHTASGQHRLGQPVPPGREQPGDLVFFHTSGDQPDYYHHVGIALGGGLMIDAPHSGAVVRIEQIWPAEYAGARRY
ncbi:hypothetical protein GCM10009765_33830 [Fodinicola feengrottensis]|uniref:NlpC/P60 domain-containing protein n=1 Tax=Fodinicola feengrottensis TaxID=435914 RepID=A0ABN2H5N0_9ACTN